MKPTTIGTKTRSPVLMAEPVASLPVARVDTGKIVLTEAQYGEVESALAGLDFEAMPSGEIIKLGFEAEQGLHQTLNSFLARLDKNSANKVFLLFGRLEKGVTDAKLPDVLKQIQTSKPGMLAVIMGKFRGKSAQELAHAIYSGIKEALSLRTKTLSDEMGRIEQELGKEMDSLQKELQSLDSLKHTYSDNISNFAVSAGVAKAFLEKARHIVEVKAADVARQPDQANQAQLEELRNKLQLLESRALALEGTYTRLPADRMVIQQIQQAGVSTLQETVITAGSRFASIKTTLLALNGALAVKDVQQIAERQARLDQQLMAVRGTLTKEIATTAVNAPGDNRLVQAAQIEQIIKETQEIHELVAAGRKINEEKFAQAGERFEAARAALANLS